MRYRLRRRRARALVDRTTVCRRRAPRRAPQPIISRVPMCPRMYPWICLAHPFTRVMQRKKFPAVVGVVVLPCPSMVGAPHPLSCATLCARQCNLHPWSVLRTLCRAPPFVRANTTPAKAAEGAAILLGGGVYSTPVPLISCLFSSVATKSVIDAIVAWRSRRRWRRAIGGRARDD